MTLTWCERRKSGCLRAAETSRLGEKGESRPVVARVGGRYIISKRMRWALVYVCGRSVSEPERGLQCEVKL